MRNQSGKFRWVLTIGVIIFAIGGTCLLTACPDSSGSNAPVAAPSDPNGAGVRPNVRSYIEATYQNSAKTRAALFQSAKVVEKALVDANNKDLSIQHAEESNRASTCLWYTFGSVDAYAKAQDGMMAVTLNTDERNKAYLVYNDQLGGQVFLGIPYDQRVTACDINPSTLPN